MNIYVGNLPYSATEEDLRQAFGQFGEVTSASIVMDRETGRSRGFAFVEMANDDEGAQAIEGMNGTEWMGRTLSVNEARPREQRPRGGSYGGGPSGGGSRVPGDSGFNRDRSQNWGGGGGGGDRSGRGGGDRDRGGRRDYDKRRGGSEGNFRKRSTSKDNDRSWSMDDDDDF